MKKFLYIFLLLSVVLTVLSACKESDDNPPYATTVSRTVLVYMAANNSPALPHQMNYNEMVNAVNSTNLNGGRLIVFKKTSSNGMPELIELKKDQQITLKSYPAGTNTVDPEVMSEVIADVQSLAPANEYGLLLWSHASGWTSPIRSWGQDKDFTGAEREMSIPDLADAISEKQFRFIYMDCCFMGNIETLYELRDAADYIIASSTETPYSGMDYARNIPEFFATTLDLKQIVANTHDAVASLSRNGDECGISISLYDMAKIMPVQNAVKAIYAATPKKSVDVSSIQQYGFDQLGSHWNNYFFDLRHYMGCVTSNATLLNNLDNAMSQFIPLTLHTDKIWQKFPLNNAHGVSVFIPESSNLQSIYHYDELEWYADVVAPYFFSTSTAH